MTGQSEEPDGGSVENVRPSSYLAFLNEPHRPPSRGGNTGAQHAHVLVVDGQKYSFLALGARKWVYLSDTVSFTWKWDASRKYRNIDPSSVKVRDKTGADVVRGLRGAKRRRTAQTRMPVSRREMHD